RHRVLESVHADRGEPGKRFTMLIDRPDPRSGSALQYTRVDTGRQAGGATSSSASRATLDSAHSSTAVIDAATMRTRLKLPARVRSSSLIRVLLGAVVGWFDDRAVRLAASLSFFTMLSLAPLLLITLQIVGVLLGPEAAAGQLEAYLRQMVGPLGAEVLQEIVAEAGRDERGYLATAFSVGILVFTASYVFAELQDAMNTVWNVKTAEGWAVWQIVRNRLIAFGMVLSLAFLLLVSLVVSTVLTALTTYFFPEPGRIAQLVDSIVSLIVISAIFAALFKFVPDVRIRWSDVWPGALLT